MGFNCQLYVLRHVEDFYVLESVDSISFPTTNQDIKENRIEKLITCLETAKVKNPPPGFWTIIERLFIMFIFIEFMPGDEKGYQKQQFEDNNKQNGKHLWW